MKKVIIYIIKIIIILLTGYLLLAPGKDKGTTILPNNIYKVKSSNISINGKELVLTTYRDLSNSSKTEYIKVPYSDRYLSIKNFSSLSSNKEYNLYIKETDNLSSDIFSGYIKKEGKEIKLISQKEFIEIKKSTNLLFNQEDNLKNVILSFKVIGWIILSVWIFNISISSPDKPGEL